MCYDTEGDNMKDITVIAVGNMKEEYFREAISEYAKRISAYARITVKELKEEKLDDAESESETAKALEKEGKAILDAIPKGSVVVSLCVEGKKYTSESFASLIESSTSNTPVTFIIGSSHGLCSDVKKRSDFRVSFSDMTFPHRLMRVILFEQIYRGLSILNNGKYHK